MTVPARLIYVRICSTAIALWVVVGARNSLRAQDQGGAGSTTADAADDHPDDPPNKPVSQEKEVDNLIKQLGDGDYKAREKAEVRLKQIGQPAVAALENAKKSTDPEVVTRANSVLEKITHKVTLFQRPRVNAGGGIGQRIHVTVFNDVRKTEVFDGDVTIRIVESPRGIDMSVTGIEAGQAATDRVQAANATELQQKNPDAYRIYAKWGTAGGAAPAPGAFPGRIFPPGFGPPGMPGPLMIRPAAIQPMPAAMGDDLTALRQKLDEQMTDASLPQPRRAKVMGKLDELNDLQLRGADRLGQPADEKEVRAYNEKSDELRKLLADLKLPDPGDELPPPARSRLGVSLGGETINGVVITRVLPESRGEKLGLKDRDVITHVNGQRVRTARDIRRILTEADKPAELELMRDNKEMKLQEKPSE